MTENNTPRTWADAFELAVWMEDVLDPTVPDTGCVADALMEQWHVVRLEGEHPTGPPVDRDALIAALEEDGAGAETFEWIAEKLCARFGFTAVPAPAPASTCEAPARQMLASLLGQPPAAKEPAVWHNDDGSALRIDGHSSIDGQRRSALLRLVDHEGKHSRPTIVGPRGAAFIARHLLRFTGSLPEPGTEARDLLAAGALAELRELEQTIAPPGWSVSKGGELHDPLWIIEDVVRDPRGTNALDCGSDQKLAEFIVAVRNGLPALLDALVQAQHQLQDAQLNIQAANDLHGLDEQEKKDLTTDLEGLQADLDRVDAAAYQRALHDAAHVVRQRDYAGHGDDNAAAILALSGAEPAAASTDAALTTGPGHALARRVNGRVVRVAHAGPDTDIVAAADEQPELDALSSQAADEPAFLADQRIFFLQPRGQEYGVAVHDGEDDDGRTALALIGTEGEGAQALLGSVEAHKVGSELVRRSGHGVPEVDSRVWLPLARQCPACSHTHTWHIGQLFETGEELRCECGQRTPVSECPATPDLDTLRNGEGDHSDLVAFIDRLITQRDLALAHDRQPYPTAEAYERTCQALSAQRERAERAEADLERLRQKPEPVAAELGEQDETLLALVRRFGAPEVAYEITHLAQGGEDRTPALSAPVRDLIQQMGAPWASYQVARLAAKH
ncbi:hypothetical protein [Nocardiopsis synnemataformans]|uniref:hypothetical protein n=1 Tax=Nocardiopsis synnemataformans TaxID=61305 RepID=UPI003EB8E3E4